MIKANVILLVLLNFVMISCIMFNVIVEVYAPLHFAPGSYDWIIVGDFETEAIDAGVMKENALRLIEENGYKPAARMMRLHILNERREKIDMILVDAW